MGTHMGTPGGTHNTEYENNIACNWVPIRGTRTTTSILIYMHTRTLLSALLGLLLVLFIILLLESSLLSTLIALRYETVSDL